MSDLLDPSAAVLAQVVPFDPTNWAVFGPLGLIVGVLLWYIGKQDAKIERMQERMDKLVEAHKVEIAAERRLNAEVHEDRLSDQKVLIPLSNSMVTAIEILRVQGDRK